MGKKRPSPLDEPPPAESSEEEEESSGEEEEEEEEEEGTSSTQEDDEEEDDEDDEEENQQHPKPANSAQPSNTPVKKPEQPPVDSDSETDSEAEPEPETPRKPPPTNVNVKPSASNKPIEKISSPKKPVKSTPVKSTPVKRVVENNETPKESKRAKKADEGGDVKKATGGVVEESAKKQLFQRLYSEEDEIAILQGIIDFVSEKGMNPVVDMDAFHEFIKNLIHIDVTKAQLLEKVRRLKKKYENNVKKPKRKFSKEHDRKGYDLSEKIWGSGGAVTLLEEDAKLNGTAKKTPKVKKSLPVAIPTVEADRSKVKLDFDRDVGGCAVTTADRMIEMYKLVNGWIVDEGFIREGVSLMGTEKAAEFESKWKQLQMEQLEVHQKQAELASAHMKCILQAHKSKLG